MRQDQVLSEEGDSAMRLIIVDPASGGKARPALLHTHGGGYVATESRSMIIGAFAFTVYSFLVCQILIRVRSSALTATAVATVAWIVIAVGLKQVVLG